MLRSVPSWILRSGTKSARPARPRIAIEPLEDRTVPAFVTASSFPVGPNGGEGSKPVAIAVGDFNRDGRMDVATANQDVNGISVRLGNGNGTFKASVNYAVGPEPVAIRAVDLNGDGKLDLVTTNDDQFNDTADSVSVLIGRGDGTFKAAVTFAVGPDPVSVAAGDLNGDGKVDLAVANNGASTVSLFFGTGAGKFTAAGTVNVGTNPTSVVVADFNNDNKPDLASVSGGFGHLDVNLNTGNGTFATKVNYETGFCANTVVVADFNDDDQPDLAVACTFPSGDGVSVLLGNPNGTFQPWNDYNAGAQTPATLAVADFNGDGHTDVVTANGQFANNSVSVMLGDGTGALGPARVFVAGQNPLGVAVGDFNSDGVPDVVTADEGEQRVGDTFGGPIGTVSLLLGNGDGTLAAAPSLVARGANHLVTADFTGDNLPDLAVSVSHPDFSGVLLFPGIGGGAFGTPVESPEIFASNALAAGDFNGDGKKDVAVIGGVGGSTVVQILLGNGNGTFGAPTSFPAGPSPKWIAVADFNGDQKADLAVANDAAAGIDILLGAGNGTFGAPTPVTAGGPANYVAAADLNADGKMDLAVVNDKSSGQDTVTVVYGNGDGSFGTTWSYGTEVGPGSVGVGRFNADAKMDLAVPTFFGGGVTVFQHGTNGQFTQMGQYPTDSRPVGIAITDFNGDGKLDFAVANNFADNLFVYHGTGTGAFGTPIRYVVGDRPDWVAAADYNGDGRQDLAVLNGNASTITLLQTPAPATQFRVRAVPATTTAGVAIKVTVAALDGAGTLVTGYTGTVGFTSSDPRATLPAGYKFTAADHGVHTFTVTLRTVGPQTVTVNGTGGNGNTSVVVDPAVANHLAIVASPGPTAGSPFDVTVIALDPFGNIDPGFVGTVHLTTNDSAAGVSLPADYTFTAADNGVHTFAGGVTLVTAGVRTVSAAAVGKSWPVGSGPVTVHAAAATQLTVSAPITAVAGLPVAVTVTARDQYGNVATDFTGTVTFASSDGLADVPGDYTFTIADAGVHTFQPVLKTAGSQTVTVTSAGLADGQSSGVVVKPGVAAQLSFVGGPSNTFINTPVKPPVTVQVFDAFGNPVGAGVKVLLGLANNPTLAALSGKSALTDASGLATFKLLTVSKGGVDYTLVARAGTGTSTPSSAFTVYKATHFKLTTDVVSPVVAGTSFTVTVTTLDGANRVDPTYLGTVHFSSTASPLADLPADYTFQPGDGGVHTFTVTLKRSGIRTVTVADTFKAAVKGTKSLTVTPATLSQFLVTGLPAARVNVGYYFTVMAADAFGNRLTSYRGTVQFTNANGTAMLPGPYTFKSTDAGRHTFKAIFQTPGPGQSLTVTDQVSPTLTGTLGGITVT